MADEISKSSLSNILSGGANLTPKQLEQFQAQQDALRKAVEAKMFNEITKATNNPTRKRP